MRHIHLQVFGRVQGVGFRYFTQRIAMNYNIVGTVLCRDICTRG